MLTDAGTQYWPTELEIAGLVWNLRKVRHIVELAKTPTIVYTDHAAIVLIAQQTNLTTTTATDKVNLLIIQASKYLQQFNLNICHKPGKRHIISNALSRPASCEKTARSTNKGKLDVLIAAVQEIWANLAPLVELSNDFKQKLKIGYKNNAGWKRVRSIVTSNNNLEANAAELPYQIKDKLINYKDPDLGDRLCILGDNKLLKQAFTQVHDKISYVGYARAHQRLSQGFYICYMVKQLCKYLHPCPKCQLQMTPRHLPYKSLQPIILPPRPFYTIAIDFIIALLTSFKGFNSAMLVIDKYSKRVMFIAGKIA